MEETESKDIWQKLNSDIAFGKAINDKAKQHFYTEFYSLLDAGMDIQRSMDIIIEEQDKKRKRDIYTSIQDDLIGGYSLSEALKRTTYFSAYEYQSIKIGEESGKLKTVLSQLSKYYHNKVKLRKHLISVFTYPAFVLLITVGVLYFMLNTVVPMFQEVFQQFGQDLPWLTQKIIYISDNFTTYLYIFLAAIAGIFLLHYTQKKEEWYRNYTGKIILRIPIFGKLFKKIYLARFTQSMGLLTVSKTPLVKSLDLVKEMIRFYPLEEALAHTKEEILKGNNLHHGLSKFPLFDRRFISLIKIAEEINKLDDTFERLTDQLNEDIDHQTKLLGTLMEPFIIILIGAVVGLIMVAMYLPMFNLSNVIQ
ncbi:MAG: general secretion pathway protein GspF [Fluviicola sp.]|nr:MAG: general secretion pathway protein GspF [Fluviicola sp.]